MGLQYNGTNIYGVNYNGTSLTQVNFNGIPVWYALTSCTISGVNKVGYEWSVMTNPAEVQSLCTYQWYRGGIAIQGATKDTYTTAESDRGYQLSCVAKIGSASATSNLSLVILQDVESLTLSGVTEEGYTLSANIIPSYATGTYQWYRDSEEIEDATTSSYTLTHDDATHYIKCVFVANGNYSGSVSDITSSTIIGWYSWSKSISNSTSDFVTSISASYTVPSNVICKKITCYASAYNHTAQGETETANATSYIYINGTQVAKGGTATSNPGNWCESSVSKTGTWSGGTRITVSSGGTSWRRSVSGYMSGLQKGS